MFNVSRTVLLTLTVVVLVLLVLGLATDVGLIGWVLALLLALYIVAVLVRGRRTV